MSRAAWAYMRVLGGAAILAVLFCRLGTGALLDGLRTISGWSLVAAAGVAFVTTVCSAWRWSLVARGLGVAVPLRGAIAAYYRSQFLNSALPGGVLGDVHRGLQHGRDAGDVSRGLRAVGWERLAGQAVQVVLALIVLLVLPSPVHSSMPAVLAIAVLCVLGAVGLIRARTPRGTSRWVRALRTARADVRAGLLAPRTRAAIGLSSVVVVAGHVTTFLIAARTAGATAPALQMLPLAMVVLLAMSVPTNIGGWGPREGVAAWLFAAAGLGAAQGLGVAAVYGVLVLAASLPGAAVLAITWLGSGNRGSTRAAGSQSEGLAGKADVPHQPVPVAA
jgi:uncharacterized membrane protein YbhN (UPF0104 family)